MSVFDPLVNFAIVFAGLVHDTDHSATTNLFHINTSSKLAIRYSDKSILENHHVSTTFKIL